jgi:hypothetical protein
MLIRRDRGTDFISDLVSNKFFFFANEFKTRFDVKDLNEFKRAYGVKNKNLLKKSVIILGGVGLHRIEVSLIAVGGAAFLVITRA